MQHLKHRRFFKCDLHRCRHRSKSCAKKHEKRLKELQEAHAGAMGFVGIGDGIMWSSRLFPRWSSLSGAMPTISTDSKLSRSCSR